MTDLNSKRSKRWCYTLNNYDPDDLLELQLFPCVYSICGKETAPVTGTPHLQGYMVFKSEKGLKQMKKINDEAHWEIARGTTEQNFDYCSKQGDYHEYGTKPLSQKEKGDCNVERWELALQACMDNRWADVPADIGIRYEKGLISFAKKRKVINLDDTEEKMDWYYGKSGTGKSRKAREDNKGAYYLKMCNKWWDDYNGEEVVIIEDFDKEHKCLAHHLKIWADRYPFPAEYKGGKMDIRPKKIIVTSNYHPSDIWEDERDLEPLMRRFHCTQFYASNHLLNKHN